MARTKPEPETSAAEAPPAAALRALMYAIAGLGRQLGVGQGESAITTVRMLGASLADAEALHEYLKRQGG